MKAYLVIIFIFYLIEVYKGTKAKKKIKRLNEEIENLLKTEN